MLSIEKPVVAMKTEGGENNGGEDDVVAMAVDAEVEAQGVKEKEKEAGSGTVSDASSSGDTVSGDGGEEDGVAGTSGGPRAGPAVTSPMVSAAMNIMGTRKEVRGWSVGADVFSNYFETKLNRSAVKYNRLPVSPEFAKSLDLRSNKGKEWLVRDHKGDTWPVGFHQEGGFEMIRGWRKVIGELKLDVGSVIMMFRPHPDREEVEIRRIDDGLEKAATGKQYGDVTLGEMLLDETVSSTTGGKPEKATLPPLSESTSPSQRSAQRFPRTHPLDRLLTFLFVRPFLLQTSRQ